MSETVEQERSSRGYVASLPVELPVGIKERRQQTEVMRRCLLNDDHVSLSLLDPVCWQLPPQDQPRAQVRYGRMPARAAAELFSAGPRDQDHYKGYGTRYFSTSWGLCKHTNDVESALIHYAISFGAPVAQLDRVPGYEPGGREFESLRARQ